MSNLMVKKKDGTFEPYSRTKLENGIWIACGKRPVTKEQIDKVVNKLEAKWSANKKEVSSITIGNDLIDALKKLDHIAYIRYAIVYLQLDDLVSVRAEIDRLLEGIT